MAHGLTSTWSMDEKPGEETLKQSRSSNVYAFTLNKTTATENLERVLDLVEQDCVSRRRHHMHRLKVIGRSSVL
jgi:hypothetical protein